MHTNFDLNEARALITRFYSSDLSPAELEALRSFLRKADCPAVLRDDARVILMLTEPELDASPATAPLEEGQAATATRSLLRHTAQPDAAHSDARGLRSATRGAARPDNGSRRAPRRWLYRALGAAAVLTGMAVGVWGYRSYQMQWLEARYGGSYVIQDGQRTTDLRRIRTEIEQTLALADHQPDPIRQAEVEVLEAIDDPDLRQELHRLLNE